MTFELTSDQITGEGSCKMNSSILRDPLYKSEIEDIITKLLSVKVENRLFRGRLQTIRSGQLGLDKIASVLP